MKFGNDISSRIGRCLFGLIMLLFKKEHNQSEQTPPYSRTYVIPKFHKHPPVGHALYACQSLPMQDLWMNTHRPTLSF